MSAVLTTLWKITAGFFRFWYDFIVGDCWQIAAGVAVILSVGILLVGSGSVSPTVLPVLVAAALMALVVFGAGLEWWHKARQRRP